MEPMQGIIQKTIKACAAREYFTQAPKERKLRQLFQNMRDALRHCLTPSRHATGRPVTQGKYCAACGSLV